MRRAYQMLLRLYPWDYRAAFELDMFSTFDSRFNRPGRPWHFAVAELAGLVMGAGREWISKLTTHPTVRGRALPDVRMMRPPGMSRDIWFRAPQQQSGNQGSPDMLPWR